MSEFTTLMNTLDTALSLKREHGGETEAKFVAWLCKQVCPTMIDGAGNIHVVLGTSRTMFTAHTDSVHHKEGANGIRKTATHWYGDGDALGADDGCGIALMLHMIAAGIPGRYMFFRGEECGGLGSSWLAAEMPGLWSNYDRAIAFDRAGLGDVITHQAGGRCCSDIFANALADALNADGLMYIPDATGVYTDTAEFISLIPECTNLSVGYDHQHGPKEELNIAHFLALAEMVVKVNWEALPTSRDPKVKEPRYKAPSDLGVWGGRSVFNKFAPLDESPEYWAAHSAITAARTGLPRALVALITEAVYPEDPGLVKSYIKPAHFTDDMLAEALNDLDFDPAENVLLALYDLLPILA